MGAGHWRQVGVLWRRIGRPLSSADPDVSAASGAARRPAKLPAFGGAEWGDVLVAVRLRWIKPWELDALLVLDRDLPELDPWAVLFNYSDVQLKEVVERLNNRPRDAGLFRILGGMRYRKDVRFWKDLLERIDPVLTKESFRQSLAVQEWLEEGRKEGR